MQATAFLSVDVVLQIHARVVEEFGGDPGLRDRGLLESAVAMPQSTFAGEFLHVSLAEKAAAYHCHLCANHPFADGNKRVASDDDLEKMTLGVAGGQLSKEAVVAFFERHIGKTQSQEQVAQKPRQAPAAEARC